MHNIVITFAISSSALSTRTFLCAFRFVLINFRLLCHALTHKINFFALQVLLKQLNTNYGVGNDYCPLIYSSGFFPSGSINMTSNSLRQPVTQLMQVPFHEPLLQAPQPGGMMPSGGIVQPGGFAGQESLQPKTLNPSGPPPNTIAMSTLIDFIVYKTFHDITVMSDILPSKTDLERKTSILEFSSRTRQLFIRLLSLVKWASSVGKVVRCSDISNFLDRQVTSIL